MAINAGALALTDEQQPQRINSQCRWPVPSVRRDTGRARASALPEPGWADLRDEGLAKRQSAIEQRVINREALFSICSEPGQEHEGVVSSYFGQDSTWPSSCRRAARQVDRSVADPARCKPLSVRASYPHGGARVHVKTLSVASCG